MGSAIVNQDPPSRVSKQAEHNTERLKDKPKRDSRNSQTMSSFPLKATSVVGPNGKYCDGTEPEKPCTGVISLEQPNADTITVTWDIKNLGEPGSKHGFHVHVGGLGNITADAEGHSKGSMTDHQVKLFEHEKFGSVVGRSMMIHAKEYDLVLGDNSKANEPGPPQDGFVSKITGNAGARIACGEIKLV